MTGPKPYVWDGTPPLAVGAERAQAETLAVLPLHDSTTPRKTLLQAVIDIASGVTGDEIDDAAMSEALDQLRPYAPALDEGVRADRLGDLIVAIEHEQRMDNQIGAPDGGTWADAQLAAEERVHTAAGLLIGGDA